jgi:uncharacterized protein YjbJ (UPF0337 family)
MRNRQEIKGKGKQIAGAIKDKVGTLINDRDLAAAGRAERREGQIQQKIGKTRRKAGEVMSKVGNAIAGKR